MRDDYEDPEEVETVMIAIILAIVVSAIVMITLHVVNMPPVTARSVPAIMEVAGYGRE
jgi:hypothetical protein